MKKFTLFLALLCISAYASAQFYVGGSLGVAVEHVSDDEISSTVSAFSISPEVGYDINSTWAVGITVPVRYQHMDDFNTTNVGVLPYVRGTFAHVGIVDFFGELALGYGHSSSDGYGVGGFDSALRPGMKINLNDRFALVARTVLLGFSSYDGVNDIGFAINANFELGFKVTL